MILKHNMDSLIHQENEEGVEQDELVKTVMMSSR